MAVQITELKAEEVCKIAQRDYQLARDHLKRANRDLGETAAVLLGSLTAVSAVGAVINIAVDKAGLSSEVMVAGFQRNLPLDLLLIYIALIAVLFGWGFLRIVIAFLNRWQAEKQIDQSVAQIYESCPGKLWPKIEE